MKLSNCLFWALPKWLKEGGYLIVRWSKYYPGPHFLWGRRLRNGNIEPMHYVPAQPRRRLIPPFLFRGTVKTGDKDEA